MASKGKRRRGLGASGHLSTTEMGWLLDTSAGAVRRMIRDGEVEAARIPGGFRIPRSEALRLSRERIQGETGRRLPDPDLERLIDEVLAANRGAT
jgi:excisionase family DNA binding protein